MTSWGPISLPSCAVSKADRYMLGEYLPSGSLFTAFLMASFVLAVTPGPGVFYVVARSVLQGRRYGLASVVGIAIGNFGNAAGASLGLGALFAVSALAFDVVKWAGALYLIYLGIRILTSGRSETAGARPEPASLKRIAVDGFVVALFNPKTAIFFAAFLPQFINPAGNVIGQSLLLGGIFVLIAAATDVVYALTASQMSARFTRSASAGKLGRYLSGGAFIGLGVFTAVVGSQSKG